MLEQVTNNRGIPDSNHWHNVTYLGNQAGAGSAATLCENWEKITAGQHIVVAVVGAGLSWGSMVLRAKAS
jgi:3-oxoacyl-[acyl-carrier-protein] synthase-3